MKKLLFIMLLLTSVNSLAQNACACIFYNEGAVLSCESGNCSQGRLVNCINQGGTWYNGAGQVPAGMTACDFFLPVTLSDFKGFNSICFPAGGERGICIPLRMPLFIRYFAK
jgi:hypothetical protein